MYVHVDFLICIVPSLLKKPFFGKPYVFARKNVTFGLKIRTPFKDCKKNFRRAASRSKLNKMGIFLGFQAITPKISVLGIQKGSRTRIFFFEQKALYRFFKGVPI